jgi:MoaA/NifB/PqqE/SkfB family radical SAM enzyme
MAYVSLDGCRRAHDEQRRKPGLYSQVIANIQTSSSDRIVVGCCVTTITRTSIGELVADVSRLDVLGIIFNLYTPTKISDRLMLSSSERQDTIDELLRLKREYGDFVRCTPPILERMRKRPPVGTCKLNQVITPLDAQGKRKQGCTMQGICSECGAFPLYLSESFKITEWRAMLRTVNFLRMVT